VIPLARSHPLVLVDEEFQRAKATSKKLLETTKAKITQVSDELKNEFQTNYVCSHDIV
jgi:hypothetical protein